MGAAFKWVKRGLLLDLIEERTRDVTPKRALAAREELEAENARLREALETVTSQLEDWNCRDEEEPRGSLANDAAAIAKARACLASLHHEGEPS